jgi:plasmid stabilization system protein ParE
MLQYHADFLANVSQKAADRLVDKFYSLIDTLKTRPERYTWLDNDKLPKHKYRKLTFEKHYMILYHVDGDTVFVDAVIDARQQYERFL